MLFNLEQYIANDYLRALIVLIGFFIIFKLFVIITEKVIIKLTLKTKTNIDDLIIKKSNKPLTYIILLIGLRIALTQLPIKETILQILSKIIYSLIIIASAYLVYEVVDIIISNLSKKFTKKTRATLDETLISLARKIAKIIFLILVIIYILDFWGIKIGPLLAGVGIAGIAIAFAMQDSLSNIFGGISLILDKTIKVGDLIEFDNITGTIIDIGIRSTKIKNFDNEVIIVPNGKLSNIQIRNIVLPEAKSRVVIPFGVAYGSDIGKVKEIVLNEIKKIKGISKEPEPSVKFLEMADSSLNFKAFFYMDTYKERFRAKDEANTLIYNALNKNNIEIPFPQIDVHLKKE